jgi:hypothetical protein
MAGIGPLITIGPFWELGASPTFRVVLVCSFSKTSFSAKIAGCGRERRFDLDSISRLSEELEVVLLPELTTGETSTWDVSFDLFCEV